MQNINRTKDAFQVLADEGSKSYRPECVAGISDWQKVGMALARINDSKINILQLAYEYLEDWNYHDTCGVLNWVAKGGLYEMSMNDLNRLKNVADGVYALKDYDLSSIVPLEKTVNVRVTVNIEILE